ncbi:hypothetical protein TNCV_3974061 [Trichonephila clavipes]|nr:hypothetical protein TNCV_3974061 [Trichonephila clavipes]
MLFFILTLSCTLNWAESTKCPEDYKRLSTNHTYCLPPNTTCHIEDQVVTKDEIDHILKLHNTYRSQVAMGQETRAGGLPKASDMLQMVWDDELAKVAQKWADHCVYKHDCNECRAVAQLSSIGSGRLCYDFSIEYSKIFYCNSSLSRQLVL